MKTTLLTPETDENAVKTAAELIRAGEVVGMPTETVYGLAANALNGEAVKKIFLAKGRPQDNPLIVHIADFEQIYDLCPAVPPQAKQLADAFWPGPLTMIVPKGDCIPDEVSCGLDTVGIRLPSHPMARALIRESGVPLAAPSANTSGRPSTTTAAHVMHDMDGKIAAVLDGGACGVGVESTVITLALERPRLLRPGGITLEQLRSVLGEVDVDRALYEKIGDDVKVSAPGMKYRHYAPKAPVTVVRGNPQGDYPAEIIDGIFMHRRIDVMTDNLAEVKEAREWFRPQTRRVAPITLDVMWDHFLSQHWTQLSPDLPLDEFVRYAERQIVPILPDSPPRFVNLNQYLWSERWLERYQEMDFIQRVLNGMASRRPRLEALRDSWQDLDTHYDRLETQFWRFYPQMMRLAENKQL